MNPVAFLFRFLVIKIKRLFRKPKYPLNPETQAFLDKMNAAAFKSLTEMGVAEARHWHDRSQEAMARKKKLTVHDVQDRSIPGPAGEIPVRFYWPREIAPGEKLPVVLYFHGGAFFMGNLETEDPVCRSLCKYAEVLVISVDYRLAPEFKFPAALDDCYAATCWVVENAEEIGVDKNRVAVSGGSAGGNLTIAVCLKAREQGFPEIAFQMPTYPAIDCGSDNVYPSRKESGSGDLTLSEEDLEFSWQIYLDDPEEDGHNPLASPINARDFKGLPPALVSTAEFDPLRDEGKTYAERLRKDGVSVEYKCFPGTIHTYFIFDKTGQKFLAQRLREALSA